MTGSGLYVVRPSSNADQSQLLRAVADIFDPARLTQARRLAAKTKRQLADDLQVVTASAVGLWESGATSPWAELIGPFAEILGVVPEFFAAGRYCSRITQDSAHFRSLRSTPAALRAKATVFAQQVDELTAALERLVRFTAAHELGHLLLHGDAAPADPQQEREADAFAAEFLTPGQAIVPELPARLDLGALQSLGRTWGVSIESLVYRSHEVGLLSEASYRRAFQRLRQHRALGLITSEPVRGYPGEIPTLLSSAFEVAAASHGTTTQSLAHQLRFTERRLVLLLGRPDDRPPALG